MRLDEMTTESLFDLSHTALSAYLRRFRYPWEALRGLTEAIRAYGATLSGEYVSPAEGVYVHRTARVAPTAFLGAPCVIGPETEVRHCAFIRGGALVGAGCVVGNSVELKNCVLFDGVQAPHFNYVGDSILGYKAHMGAGSITSNIKSDRTKIVLRTDDGACETGLVKFGAMLGDLTEIGCNSVLNPGSVVGRHTIVYPLTSLRGAYPAESIVKGGGIVVPRR